jgi:homoserine kinase type II
LAVYTSLSLEAASTITRAHGLGEARAVEGILAGSVNSNYFVEAARRVFVRVYEEQEADGLAYEWALLEHLARAGMPVPPPVPGPPPGTLRVAGKPIGVFEVVGGVESCQAAVDEARARAAGAFVGRIHRVGASFPTRRVTRFGLPQLEARLRHVEALDRPELADALSEVRDALEEVRRRWPPLPSGVVHGDLFRDNVRFRDEGSAEIVAVLDWESAADGAYVFDLAVALLAWCVGDHLDPALARAMIAGYQSERGLQPEERAALRLALIRAAVRFTVTRITDYHLRRGQAQVWKDYRRFLMRLRWARSIDDATAIRDLLGT